MRKRKRFSASHQASRTRRSFTLANVIMQVVPVLSTRPILLVPVFMVLMAVSFFDPVISTPAKAPFAVGYVSDGDTMTVYDEAQNKHRIRFAGIDAPESDQPGGLESKAHLMELLPKGSNIQIEEQSKDRYGRTVAAVWRDGTNINLEQIRHGHAWVYRQYNDSPQYLEAEQEARSLHKGLWADRAAIAPWEWRKQKRNKAK